MKIVYLHCELVCKSSLFALILRATPNVQRSEISEEYVAVAHYTLDMHQHRMELVRSCRDPSLMTRHDILLGMSALLFVLVLYIKLKPWLHLHIACFDQPLKQGLN